MRCVRRRSVSGRSIGWVWSVRRHATFSGTGRNLPGPATHGVTASPARSGSKLAGRPPLSPSVTIFEAPGDTMSEHEQGDQDEGLNTELTPGTGKMDVVGEGL